MDTIVVNNVYRKIGVLLIINLKVLALDLPYSVKKNPLSVQKETSLYICKHKPNY